MRAHHADHEHDRFWHERDHPAMLHWSGSHFEQEDHHRLERDHPFKLTDHPVHDHSTEFASHHYGHGEFDQFTHHPEAHWTFDHFDMFSDKDHHPEFDLHDGHELPVVHDH